LFTQEIYAKEVTFGISSPSTLDEDHEARQESRHAMNMTLNDMRIKESMSKSSGTQPENSEACIARIQALTVKEMTSKAHMQVHTNQELSHASAPWIIHQDHQELSQTNHSIPNKITKTYISFHGE
jgi:hypothetical protein